MGGGEGKLSYTSAKKGGGERSFSHADANEGKV